MLYLFNHAGESNAIKAASTVSVSSPGLQKNLSSIDADDVALLAHGGQQRSGLVVTQRIHSGGKKGVWMVSGRKVLELVFCDGFLLARINMCVGCVAVDSPWGGGNSIKTTGYNSCVASIVRQMRLSLGAFVPKPNDKLRSYSKC